MPFVTYFAARARSKTLTASDVMELVGGSTFTKGVKHPPHPHAHIAKEGFSAPLNPLEQKELQNLRAAPQPRALKDEQRYVHLLARETYEQEGVHLDPATRGAYSDPNYEVVDGKKLYIDRKLHSQFPDSESAVIALCHSLSSAAGQKALAFLEKHDQGRAVIHSLTTANALKAGALAYQNEPKKGLSAHPERDLKTGAVKAAELIKRGKGASGAAPTPLAPFVAITTVLDNDGGELTVQTHYPAHAAPNVPGIAGNEEDLRLDDMYQKLIAMNNQRVKAINKVIAANKNNAKFVNALNNLVKDQWIKNLVLGSPYIKDKTYDELKVAGKEVADMTAATLKYQMKLLKDVVAASDYVETTRDEDLVKKLDYAHMLYKFNPAVFNKAAGVTWTNKEPKILGFGVRSSGQACVICGTVHQATPGIFNKWYQCDRCGSCYCPAHSLTLVAAVVVKGPQGKKCKTMNCAGVARSIY